MAITWFIEGYGQSITKKDVRGVYVYSTGSAARTIHQSDSSSLSRAYLEYGRTVLILKRFGILTVPYITSGMKKGAPYKGKWKLEGENVTIFVNGVVQKYRFSLPVYLESIDGNINYQKEL